MAERVAEAQSLQLDVVIEVDCLSRIKTLVSRGSGYSLLAHAAAHEELERGELVLVPISDPAMRRTVYIASNPARPVKRAAREVERLAGAIVAELVRKGCWLGELIAGPATPARIAPLAVARARKAAE